MKSVKKIGRFKKLTLLVLILFMLCNLVIPYNFSYAANEKGKHNKEELTKISGLSDLESYKANGKYDELAAEYNALKNKGAGEFYICTDEEIHGANVPMIESFDSDGNGYYARAANDGKTYIIYDTATNNKVGSISGNDTSSSTTDPASPADKPMDAEEEAKRNEANQDLEFAEALQGGKLLTPIFDLLMTVGDGIMDVLQKAVLGSDAHITLNFKMKLISFIVGIIAAVAAIVLISVLTGGIGAFVAGIGGAIGSLLTTIASTGFVSMLVTAGTLVGGLAAYSVATTAFSAAVLPQITVIPTYSISPEEIFEGKLLIFDINFFNPKQLKVKLRSGAADKNIQDYNPDTDGKAICYYYKDGDEEVVTSKQSTAISLSATISKWYYSIRNLALIVMMLVLLYIGIRMMLSSIAAEKSKYQKMLGDWVISMCLVFLLQYIMVFAVNINEDIVSLIETTIGKHKYAVLLDEVNNKKNFVKVVEKDDDLKQFLVDDNNQNVYDENGNETGAGEPTKFVMPTNLVGKMRLLSQMQYGSSEYIGYALAFLVLVFYTLFFAFTYLKRVVYMAFLTVIAPLVAMTYSIDKINDGKAQAFNMWLKEYIGNLLIQPVHLMLYMILISMSFDLASENIIYTLVAIGFMMPAEKLIRAMFGLDKAKTPGFLGGATGAALTMSAMQGLNKIAGRGPWGPKGQKPPKLAQKDNNDPNGIYDRSADSGHGISALFAGESNNSSVPQNNSNSESSQNNPVINAEREALEERIADGQITEEELTPEQRAILYGGNGMGSNENIDANADLGESENNNDLGSIHEPIMLDESRRQMEEQGVDANVDNNIDNPTGFGQKVKAFAQNTKGKAANRLAASGRAMMNNFATEFGTKDAWKNRVKSAAVTTAKGGAKLTGTVLGASIGAAAGIASGDVQGAVKNSALGASVGNSLGNGLVNSASMAKDKYKESKTEWDKERYGEDYSKIKKKKADQKFVKDVEARKYYEREFSKDLKGLDATERKAALNKIMDDAVKYRQEGVTDNAVIAKAMKLDRNDRTNKDNIAAAIMANKAKDMDSMEKYQKQLEKYIPKDRASNITDKARKIGGLSIK